MDYAYHVEAWAALYTALAGATAALAGLLFFALSLNLHVIVKVPAYTARARETLGSLISLLILSIFILIPGQDRRLLGGELVVESLVLALISARLVFQTLTRISSDGRIRWALRLGLLNLGTLTFLFAGISLILGRFGGLYWLIPTILIYLLWSLNNAWILMVQAVEESR